mgnify:CR=1 FL=1
MFENLSNTINIMFLIDCSIAVEFCHYVFVNYKKCKNCKNCQNKYLCLKGAGDFLLLIHCQVLTLTITIYFSFCTTISTYFLQISSLSASTITRITGSVPDSRTRIRPVSPSSAATCSIAACTS